jgi:hypothetical protein
MIDDNPELVFAFSQIATPPVCCVADRRFENLVPAISGAVCLELR